MSSPKQLDRVGVDASWTRWIRRTRSDEAGFGLIEAVVALFLLALILVPVTRVALTTTDVSNSMRLRLEAADLASQKLSYVAYSAEQGQQWAQGVTTDEENSANDSFLVSVDVEPVNAATQCVSGGTPQAWSAMVTVSWGGGTAQASIANGEDVQESTIIPAPRTGSAASDLGEIAIPVYTPVESLETDQSISITIVGVCNGASCPSQPYPGGPPYATETVGSNQGCAIFTDLYAGSGWTYTAHVANSYSYVDPSEHSSAPGATPPTLAATLTATAGIVTAPPGGEGFVLAPGASVQVGFTMTNFVGVATSPPNAAPIALPITVNSTEPGLSCQPNGCTLGDGLSTFNGQNSALLYPLQASASAGSDDYEGWAGGTSADPSAYCTTSVTPCAVGPTSFDSSSGSAQFPVYPLEFAVSGIPSGTSVSFSATPVGSSTSLTLNSATAAGSATSASSVTGLPLGEYELTATPSTVAPDYIWITPSGVCTWTTKSGSAPNASAPTPCATPSTAPIAVTA